MIDPRGQEALTGAAQSEIFQILRDGTPRTRSELATLTGLARSTVAARVDALLRDNSGEFINHALIGWAADRDLFFTRSRPYRSNDNAHVEQKNGDVVRGHAFHYRYDTATELKLLNDLGALVRLRLNLFTATTKAIGWRSNRNGKNVRVYDKPRTPYQRVIDSGILTSDKILDLATQFEAINPAELTRGITAIQTRLIHLAAAKTTAHRTSVTRAKPDEAREHISRAS